LGTAISSVLARLRNIGRGEIGLDILAVVVSRVAMFGVLFWTSLTFDTESIARGLVLIYGLSTILYLGTWVSSYRSRSASPVGILLYFQFLVEVFVEAAIFYSNDGYLSDYGLLFILTILSAGFFFRYVGAFTIALSATALFAYAGLVHLGLSTPMAFQLPLLLLETVQVRFFLFTTLFFMVALLSSMLAGRLHSTRRELEGAHDAMDRYQFSAETVMDDLPTGLLFFDETGRLKFKNGPSQEWIGKPLEAGMPAAQVLEGLISQSQLDELMNLREDYPLTELDLDTASGQSLHVQIKSLKRDSEYLGCVILMIDFTQERRMAKVLLRSERMAALGTMSARIAHEIRNPLASISGSAQMLADANLPNDSDRKLLGLIVTESARLDRILSGMLDYARESMPSYRQVSIAEIFKKIQFLIEKSPQYNKDLVIIDQIIENGDIQFFSDPDILVQVLLNVVLNGLQSLKGGSGILELSALREGNDVRIKVRDNGSGMTSQEAARAFEPFFTSKATGTGLGLSTCLHYVQALEGNINLNSELEVGTVVTITLPLNQNGMGLRQNGD
jgi:two-component system, NtrC family, sensor histidine kinase PilS